MIIILLSDNYFKSIAYLSEMGGIWITGIEYINIYLPGFNFEDIKYNQSPINTKKIGINLDNNNCFTDLIQL